MPSGRNRFRVVVIGARRGDGTAAEASTERLAAQFPLLPDARVALETGRSAVLAHVPTEAQARRVATQITKLGFEVRIEMEEGAAADVGAAEWPSGGLAASVTPDAEGEASATATHLGREDLTEPMVEGRPLPWADPSDGPSSPGGPESFPSLPDEDPPRSPASPGSAEDAVSAERLVRCPAHGLLYDASKTHGCSRCVGRARRGGGRGLVPWLRDRPRLWLALGVLLSLGAGAIPATLYAQHVKRGPLLERRAEVQGVLRAAGGGESARAAYRDAVDRVAQTRFRAMLISALLWLGTAIAVLLLYRRFV